MTEDRDQALAQFHRKQAKDGPVDIDGEYQAFKAVDGKQRRVLIKPVDSSCEWVTYQYLLRIVLDPRETRVALIFSFMAVTISGRNLGGLASAVADERCDYIQQFDGNRWSSPPGMHEAFVERIEFMTDRPPV